MKLVEWPCPSSFGRSLRTTRRRGWITLSALEPLDAPEVFDAIERAMTDLDLNVRNAAMTLMERRSDSRAAAWLIHQLRDESRRDWALRALATPRDHRLEEILTALETADAVLAPMLVTVLTRMQRADGSAAVVSVLAFENTLARRAAASALVAASTTEARRSPCHRPPSRHRRRSKRKSVRPGSPADGGLRPHGSALLHLERPSSKNERAFTMVRTIASFSRASSRRTSSRERVRLAARLLLLPSIRPCIVGQNWTRS